MSSQLNVSSGAGTCRGRACSSKRVRATEQRGPPIKTNSSTHPPCMPRATRPTGRALVAGSAACWAAHGSTWACWGHLPPPHLQVRPPGGLRPAGTLAQQPGRQAHAPGRALVHQRVAGLIARVVGERQPQRHGHQLRLCWEVLQGRAGQGRAGQRSMVARSLLAGAGRPQRSRHPAAPAMPCCSYSVHGQAWPAQSRTAQASRPRSPPSPWYSATGLPSCPTPCTPAMVAGGGGLGSWGLPGDANAVRLVEQVRSPLATSQARRFERTSCSSRGAPSCRGWPCAAAAAALEHSASLAPWRLQGGAGACGGASCCSPPRWTMQVCGA
jgi:hypothetical protein